MNETMVKYPIIMVSMKFLWEHGKWNFFGDSPSNITYKLYNNVTEYSTATGKFLNVKFQVFIKKCSF